MADTAQSTTETEGTTATEQEQRAPGTPDQGAPQSSPPAAANTTAAQQSTRQNGATGNAPGQTLPLDTFDEEDDGNSGESFTLTGEQLKERLKRARERTAARLQAEMDAERLRVQQEAEAAKRKADEEKLTAEGKIAELAESRLTSLTEAQDKLKAAQAQVKDLNAYKDAVEGLLKEELKRVPPEYRELLTDVPPLKQLDWIAKHRAKLTGAQEKAPEQGQNGAPETAEQGTGTPTEGAARQNGAASSQTRSVPGTPRAEEVLAGMSEKDREAALAQFRAYNRGRFG